MRSASEASAGAQEHIITNPSNEAGLVEQIGASDFASTLERLTAAIEGAGLQIFARIDHAAGARAIGMDMLPAVVLVYGHARGGTPIMQACPQAALDLPLRVLVRQDEEGRTRVAFRPVGAMLRQFGVTEELAARLEPAQRLLLGALSP
ncbi:DUF302 domain-containing protein [Variovorax sp. PBL-E5]|uniref:DUF302 domain-containing protein n=1 Tax=Variovorax sp. PBL-E5 TaxID=434014 RepID=UPI001315C0DE|nr:DUF302 domain-containing protein [Variovorax sp. PBL-E5]VTU30230.1 hypothetical protein E5CHR_02973 [Variovorax sp. PBL-E5]